MNSLTKNRIESIDLLRGIVMVIMALDHVRDYFHSTSNTTDPLDLVNYNIPLFFTRWITHFCAPIFVFLSGTSIYLQSFRKPKKQLGSFVFKRGLWLIFAEWTIIAFAWTFNPYFNVFPFQVIWAIGISMVLLGVLLYINTSFKAILILATLIVLGHNALDFIEANKSFSANFWWDFFHSGVFKFYKIWGNHNAVLVYPFLPWTGLMLLGYCFGKFFESNVALEQRAKKLRVGGIVLVSFFLVLRFINVYGDPFPWASQTTFIQTFLAFIKVNKYPPSLLFMSLTIGCGLLALSYLENVKNRFSAVMRIYGRTAFFYYILHLYLIHLIAVAFYFIHGNAMGEIWNIGENFPFLFVVPGQGENLLVVYILWILVVFSLYPLCKLYDKYKTTHKEKWWLSYL